MAATVAQEQQVLLARVLPSDQPACHPACSYSAIIIIITVLTIGKRRSVGNETHAMLPAGVELCVLLLLYRGLKTVKRRAY